jgi:hypothetical protein
VAEDKDTVERAKEILVYGPIGLALYMRDTAPSFLKVFVARGRAEVDQRKRTVEEHLGQAKNVGQETVNPTSSAGAAASAAASSAAAAAPQVLRIVSDGLGRVREAAGGALGVLGVDVPPAPPTPASPGPASPGPASSRPAPPAESPTGVPTGPSFPAASAAPGAAAAASVSSSVTSDPASDPVLAIPDYDELSASQVVDRLDGLAPGALEAIRAYEAAHRGRATILGKIEQLSQPG